MNRVGFSTRRTFLAGISSLALAGVRPVRASESWTIGLWQSHALTVHAGRNPEENAITTIEHAFDHADVAVDIDAAKKPVVLPDGPERPTCSGKAFDYWFRQRSHPSNRSNLLLTDFGGGGCAAVGGSSAMAGGADLADEVDHAWQRPWSRVGMSLFAILHELAHNAGYAHAEPTGFAYEIGDEIHVSPATTWAVDDVHSSCGGDHPDIDPRRQIFHLYYSPCTAGLFKTNR